MRDKHQKNTRTLDMYVRFCEGKVINKSEEARRFNVDERTVQRDIDDIRTFLDERRTTTASDMRVISYDRAKKGFVMTGAEASAMTNSEVLAVSKILLESRAFTKKEISGILNKLVEGCVPIRNMKLVSDLISNEKYHYVELHHKTVIKDRLWELGTDVRGHNLIEIKYARTGDAEKSVRRVVEPVALMFSEYYFYLNAYIVEPDASGSFVHLYDYPAIFRLDRIQGYKKMGQKFRVSYVSRFEEGEFRKRIQFMYPGRLMRVRLKYSGDNPEAVLDRLPTADVVERGDHESIIEAEVYGNGIVMWLLSQGSRIEVLKPDSLRQEMKRLLEEMLGKY